MTYLAALIGFVAWKFIAAMAAGSLIYEVARRFHFNAKPVLGEAPEPEPYALYSRWNKTIGAAMRKRQRRGRRRINEAIAGGWHNADYEYGRYFYKLRNGVLTI